MNEKILLVDDAKFARKVAIKSLQNGGFDNVIQAATAAETMELFEKEKPDLVLLDYEMPIVDGKQVLEMIRAEEGFADIPVIFLTGVTDSGKIREALVLKPQGYLLKPIDHDKLMDAITKVIE